MLAYIYWHWPYPEQSSGAYEAALLAFHANVAALELRGHSGSHLFRVDDPPWLGRWGKAYEEWHLMSSSGTLDRLNEAAVSPSCRESHAAVAELSEGGSAALYRLRDGSPELDKAHWATWLNKPRATSYDDFLEAIGQVTRPVEAAVWGRQMVLGASPEFCIRSRHHVDLPPEIEAGARLKLEPLAV